MFQINFLIQMSVQFEILLLILGLAVHGQRLKKRKKAEIMWFIKYELYLI